MAYFPLFVELKEKQCVVIGGGDVAFRKVKTLREFDARIVVVASKFCKELMELDDILRLHKRYEKEDTKGAFLVVAATDEREVNHQITQEVKEYGCFVNSATSKEDSSFLFPGIVKKEGMTIGISSSGQSPAVTRRVRQQIEELLPTNLESLLEQMERIREQVKEAYVEEGVRKEIYYKLIQSGLNNKGQISKEMIDKVMESYDKN